MYELLNLLNLFPSYQLLKKENWTYGNSMFVDFIFAAVGAGQMAASHSGFRFIASSVTHFITALLFD